MGQKIELNLSAKERNDRAAAANRDQWRGLGLRSLNMISSPGAGKTTLLEKTAQMLGNQLAVIVGDVLTTQDADRIRKCGCQAVQIETGGGCHLNAEQVAKAFTQLNPAGLRYLIIENVGNLVCPSTYDLGEDAKVALLSLPEGDEKPSKYPALFIRADLVVITKMDLAPHLEFDLNRAETDCRKLRSDVRLLRLSAKTGLGVEDWLLYLTTSY